MRLKRNLSQRLVAETLGFDRSYLAKVEKGEREFSSELLERILNLYNSIEVSEIIEAKFDYVRIRFPTNNVKAIIENVLCMDFDYFHPETTGLYGYKQMYYLGMIRVLNSEKGSERGVLIELSGQGCRNYDSILEARQETWKDFIDRAYIFKGVATRIDVALDDFEELFSIPEMAKKLERGMYETKFKSMRLINQESLQESESEGVTIYLGSRQSLMHFCFYQKNYETAKREKIPVEEVDVKNRYEVRMTNEKAREFLKHYMTNFDFSSLILGIISNQLTMFEYDRKGGLTVWKKWHKLVGNAEAINLKIEPEKPSFRKKLSYLDYFMSRTIALVNAKDKAIGTTHLKDIIARGEENLRESDEKLLEIELAEVDELAKTTGAVL